MPKVVWTITGLCVCLTAVFVFRLLVTMSGIFGKFTVHGILSQKKTKGCIDSLGLKSVEYSPSKRCAQDITGGSSFLSVLQSFR